MVSNLKTRIRKLWCNTWLKRLSFWTVSLIIMCKAPYFIMNDIFKMAKFRFFTFYKLIFIFLLCILTLLRKSSFETSTFVV